MMKQKHWVSAMIVAVLFAGAAQARTTVGSFSRLFRGVDYANGQTTADATDPINQVVNVLRVDLTDPTVSFFTNPQAGPLNTMSQTGTQFVNTYGVQAAINANFFSYVSDLPPSTPETLNGLQVSQGNLVSPVSTGFGSAILKITQNNQASFDTTSSSNYDLSGIYTAVAGSGFILTNGVNTGGTGTTLAPRTAVGLSQDSRYLYMMTIDGRQAASGGATFAQTADWLQRFGAYNGLNLDGGGSTEMVINTGSGATVVNVPSDGVERYGGSYLGIFAQPEAVPLPASMWMGLPILIGLALWRWGDHWLNRRRLGNRARLVAVPRA